SCQLKELLKVGHFENLLHVRRAIQDANVGLVAARVFPKQEQHAERGTVEIVGLIEIDDVVSGTREFRVGITKLSVDFKIEPAPRSDRERRAVGGELRGQHGISLVNKSTLRSVIAVSIQPTGDLCRQHESSG